jgi:aerobic-type carbon monoxide dehydrogenase small subunit (CoxS/CutS family)
MSDEILLVVNGKRHTLQAAEDTPLLYLLQNELGLTACAATHATGVCHTRQQE